MNKAHIRSILAASWRVLATAIVITLGISLLLFSRLETLLPGYAKAEVQTASASSSLQHIIDNPINAPHKIVVYGIGQAINDRLLATRVASAIFGTLCIFMFYYLIRKVHCKRVAFLSALLFACSAWFLHAARFGTPDILLPFAVLMFALSGYLIIRDGTRNYQYLLAILALGICLYVPGMVWFVLAGLIIRRGKDIRVMIRTIPIYQIIFLCVMLVAFVIAPLLWAIGHTPSLVLSLLGLPQTIPQPVEFLKQLVLVPVSLFAYTPENPAVWLGHLPLLDIASSALFFLGIYYYYKFRALDRAKMLGVFMLCASVLIALDNGVANAILLPAAYVCISGGVALLMAQWFTVFPKNPLAETVGVVVVALIVGSSMFYNMRSYFVAWPHWPPAKSVYTYTDINSGQ